MSDETNDTALSLREKLALTVLLLILKVIKPMTWSHQIDEFYDEIKALIKKGA